MEAVHLFHDHKLVAADQLPASLFQGEGSIFLDLLKAWGRCPCLALEIAEKELVCLVDALGNVLDSLSVKHFPKLILGKLFELGKMRLQLIAVEIFSGQAVVSPVESNTVVVHNPSYVDLGSENAILFVPV